MNLVELDPTIDPSTPQDQAVRNIDGAKMFSITPDAFKDHADVLEPEVRKMERAPASTPRVAEAIQQSDQHASAILPDEEHLSWIERAWKSFGDGMARSAGGIGAVPTMMDNPITAEQVQRQSDYTAGVLKNRFGPEHQLSELIGKKMSGTLTPDEKLELMSLRTERATNFGQPTFDYEPGSLETMPASIIASVADLPFLIKRNAGPISAVMAAGTTAGAVTGGFAGAAGGPLAPATVPGGIIAGGTAGFVGSIRPAMSVGMVYDAYTQSKRNVYDALDTMMNPDGSPMTMDEQTKKYLAEGAGVLSGGVMGIAEKLLAPGASMEGMPMASILKDPKLLATFLNKAENSAIRDSIIKIGKTVAIGGGQSAVGSVTQTIAEELGKTTGNGNKFSLENGLANATHKLASPEGRAQLKTAFVEGAATMVGQEALLHGGGKAVKFLRNEDSNITSRQSAPRQQAIDIMKFQDALDATAKVAEATKLYNLAPDQVSKIMEKIHADAGVDSVYMTKEDLQEMSTTPELGERLRKIIDPTGEMMAGMNAPMKIPLHEFTPLLKDNPTMSEYMRLHPEGPNAKQAKAFAEAIQAHEAALPDIMKKIEEHKQTPEERAKTIQLSADADPQFIRDTLRSKEAGEAYLQHVREMPEPEGMLNDQGQNLTWLTAREALIQKVEKEVATLPNEMSAKEILDQALQPQYPDNDVFGEANYLDIGQPSDNAKKLMGEKLANELHEAHLSARKEILANQREAALYEQSKVIDFVEAQANEISYDEAKARIAEDPNYDVVDKFYERAAKEFGRETHHKKGASSYAIDPRQMSEAQRKQFPNEGLLKEHRAFADGGLSPDKAARLVGVKDGHTLLLILQNTEDRQTVLDRATEAFQERNRIQATDSVDFNQTALDKSLRRQAETLLRQMKIVKEASWTTTKRGIKRIGARLPYVEDLYRKADTAINSMKIKDLNVNQFKVGERKSTRMYLDASTKGDVEGMYQHLESTALNVAMTATMQKRVGEVNRITRRVARMFSPENQQILKDGGGLKAFNEVAAHFNMMPERNAQAVERNGFLNWAKRQLQMGNGDFTIPDRLNDVRVQRADMTVEQYTMAGERLQQIMHVSREKSIVRKELAKRMEAKLLSVVSDEIDTVAHENPDFDENKSVTAQGGNKGKSVPWHASMLSMIKGIEHIALRFDNDKIAGKLHEHVIAPLKEAMGKKNSDYIELKKQYEGIIKTFNGESNFLKDKLGQSAWARMANERVMVDGWKENKLLSGGDLSKADLFMMLLNSGNEGNIDRMTKGFGISIESIREAIDTHLEPRHVTAAQNIWNTFNSYGPRVADLHERTTGVRPEMVEAARFEQHGRSVEGGYFPIIYESEMSVDALIQKNKDVMAQMNGEKKASRTGGYYSDGMTKASHANERVGWGGKPLTLSINAIGQAHEMILHDLNFREPLANVMKVLDHKPIADNIASVVGLSDYNVLKNTVVSLAQSTTMENNALFDGGKMLQKVLSNFRSAQAVALIAFRTKSLIIQGTAQAVALERMGPSGGKHLISLLGQIRMNPDLLAQMHDFAAEILPDIRDHQAGINEGGRDPVSNLMPRENTGAGSKLGRKLRADRVTAVVDGLNQLSANGAFGALGAVDNSMKVVTTVSAFKQFMAGDAPGYRYDDIMKMDANSRYEKAKQYAASVARLTLTSTDDIDRAAIQKHEWLRNLVPYWNDARNMFGNISRMGRNVKNNAVGAYKETRENGVTEKGVSLATQAAQQALTGAGTLIALRVFEESLRGFNTPLTTDHEDGLDAAMDWGEYAAWTPIDMTLSTVPVLRDINFAVQKATDWNSKDRSVQLAALKPATDAVDIGVGAYNFMQAVNEAAMQKDMSPITDFRPKKREFKALVNMTTALSNFHLPVNALFDLYESKVKHDEDGTSMFQLPFAEQIGGEWDKLMETQAKLPEKDKLDPDILEGLKGIKEQFEPGPGASNGLVPKGTIEKIARIESGGVPQRDVASVQSETSSAAGKYQFTTIGWKDVKQRAPDLGLTDEGRTSSPEQQEAAMQWVTNYNAKKLVKADLDVNVSTLYTAHFLGIRKAIDLLNAPADAKVKTILSEKAMTANSFSSNMKVRDLKAWIGRKVRGTGEASPEPAQTVASLDNPSA